jgi:hypothetical protein
MLWINVYKKEISPICSQLSVRGYLGWLWWGARGPLCPTRYAIGRWQEKVFGYEPDCAEWPFRLARLLGLSGYPRLD